MRACPHCGVALPAVVDAFCPECREPLGEPPEPRAATGAGAPAGGGASPRRVAWPKVAIGLGAAVGVLGALARSGALAGEAPAFVAGSVCGGAVLGAIVGAVAGLIWSAGRTGTRS